MNFVIEKNDLLNSLSVVSKAISSKIDNNILENIYLKAKSNILLLKGANLDMYIEMVVPCVVYEEGEFLVNSKILLDIIRKLPNQTISFEFDKKSEDTTLKIKCKKSEFDINYLLTKDYPVTPKVIPSKEITIPQKYIKEMVKGTSFAVGTDESRPILQGILFEVKNKKLNLVALDGYRMAINTQDLDIDVDSKFSAVLSGKAFSEIARLLDEDDDVSIKLTENHILFATRDTIILSRLLEGSFIDYNALLPKNNPINLTIDKEDFENAIERASSVGKVDDKILVKLETNDNKVIISSNSKVGRSVEEIECKVVGGNVKIAFNSKFMLDILKTLNDKTITLNLNSSVTPCVLNNEHYQYLVLPVRLVG